MKCFKEIIILYDTIISIVCCDGDNCYECCCCNKNNSPSSIKKKKFKTKKFEPDYITSDEIKNFIDKGSVVMNYENRISESNEKIKKVKNLLDTKFNCKIFLGKKYDFPHIHWNGSLKDSYGYLCYMLAPLNAILNLECVRTFLKGDNYPKDANSAWFVDDIGFLRVFRLYVEYLEKGESFTLDPGKKLEDIYEVGLLGKVSANTMDVVINKIFETFRKFNNCPKIEYIDFDCDKKYQIGVDEDGVIKFISDLKVKDIDFQNVIDLFKEKNKSICDYDIICMNLSTVTEKGEKDIIVKDKKLNSDVKTVSLYKPKKIYNIPIEFECCGNKYVLKSLLFFGTNSRILYDYSNDCFSFIYDKNVVNDKKYVYCQMNKDLKHYSIEEIQNGIAKFDRSEFPYRYNYLEYVFYEKQN